MPFGERVRDSEKKQGGLGLCAGLTDDEPWEIYWKIYWRIYCYWEIYGRIYCGI
jgi:hypothetical protein